MRELWKKIRHGLSAGMTGGNKEMFHARPATFSSDFLLQLLLFSHYLVSFMMSACRESASAVAGGGEESRGSQYVKLISCLGTAGCDLPLRWHRLRNTHRITKEAEEEHEGTEYKQMASLGVVQVLCLALRVVVHRESCQSSSGLQ